MKFCSECAHPVTQKIPPDDNRLRYVCDHCHTIHYQNPKLVVGTLPVWTRDGAPKILLCRRAIEPRYGYWTLPAGFMENGETTEQAAMRETVEESGATVTLHELFSIVSVTHVDQVHLFYHATLENLDYQPGTESLEVALFAEEDMPWEHMAFQTAIQTLRAYFEQAKICGPTGPFPLYSADIIRPRSVT